MARFSTNAPMPANDPSYYIESKTHLEHLCRLRYDPLEPSQRLRLTCLIGTIGKSSRNQETIYNMIMTGINIFRLNFSYDKHANHMESIEMIRTAAAQCSRLVGYNVQVAIGIDIKGPEIRTGYIDETQDVKEVDLKMGEAIKLSIQKHLLKKGNKNFLYVDYENIVNVMHPGNFIYIDNGLIKLVVKEVAPDYLICHIQKGGLLGSCKVVILPGVSIDLPPVSEKDQVDIKFGVANNVDFVFAPGVRTAGAINEVRNNLGEKGKNVKVIAKIENLQAMENLDEIIAAADGILVARNVLVVEVPILKVFLIQKAVIQKCNKAGKPVIASGQILESMRDSPVPLGCEVADLGCVVLDGCDCLMLSSETAVGNYPLESVAALDRICREAEAAMWNKEIYESLLRKNFARLDIAHAIAISAVESARKSQATAILVLCESGNSARLISKYRPRCPILLVTNCPRVARQSILHRNIVPIVYPKPPNDDYIEELDLRTKYALFVSRRMGIVSTGNQVVLLTPWQKDAGFTNNIRIVYAIFERDSNECGIMAEDMSRVSQSRMSRLTDTMLPVETI